MVSLSPSFVAMATLLSCIVYIAHFSTQNKSFSPPPSPPVLWALKILVYTHSLFDILYCSVCLTLVVVQHWFCYIGPLGLSLICSISEIYVPVRKNVTLLHSVKNASAWMKQWKCWGWSPRLSDNTSSKGHRGVTFPLDKSIPYVYHIRISAICIPYKDISHLYTI